MKIKKPSDADFCLCDHEDKLGIPNTMTCIFVCPTKARQMMKPFIDRMKANRDKKDDKDKPR